MASQIAFEVRSQVQAFVVVHRGSQNPALCVSAWNVGVGTRLGLRPLDAVLT